jgi:hypothetical protein
MTRSQRIPLRLVPIVAAAFLAGCGPQRKSCIDQAGNVVVDANCTTPQSQGTGTSWDTRGSGSVPYYHWYWYRGARMGYGSHVSSGSWFSRGGHASSATSRGGFGSTAAGHAGSAG